VLERVRHLTVLKVAGRAALSDLSRTEVDDVEQAADGIERADLQRWFRILIDGYEEIARSRHPRLVLEMAVVRMATLPPLVPLDELVTRLEALEGGRGGGPAAPPRPRPARPTPIPASPKGRRTEAAAPRGAPSPPEEERSAPEASEQVRWRGLVESLQRERASRFFRLAYSRLLEIGDGVIRIAVAGPEAITALEDGETRRMIEEAIAREYGQALRFEPVAPDGRGGGGPQRNDPRSLERQGREDPLVQMSVEVLQGKVEAVVPRERREE
jgi:DNA polymerase-3 subunit gamma/tau